MFINWKQDVLNDIDFHNLEMKYSGNNEILGLIDYVKDKECLISSFLDKDWEQDKLLTKFVNDIKKVSDVNPEVINLLEKFVSDLENI